MSELTPSQAADVIRWVHDGENKETRRHGWKDKVSLGLAAVHATKVVPGLEPQGGGPLLTHREASVGLQYADRVTPFRGATAESRNYDWAERAAGEAVHGRN